MTSADSLLAIERILAAYALLLDSNDVSGCVDLFTDDCVFAVAGNDPIEGRDALHRYFDRVHTSGAAGIHLAGPALIDVADDDATATAWQNFFFVRNGSNAVVRGMYRDAIVRDEGRWRFRQRAIEIYPSAAS